MRALLASLLLSALGPAQQLYNLTLPVGGTVIEWNGKPALCIVNMQGGGYLAKFAYPGFPPFNAMPKVELQVVGLGVWDFRPCAVDNPWELLCDDVAWRPYRIPPSGLFLGVPFGRTIGYQGGTGAYSTWQVSYCPASGPCGQCGVNDREPEGVCLVAYLALK